MPQVRCPTLVIQGSEDAIVGGARGAAVAEAIPHARLITLEGCGHAPHLRDPVITNLLLREFIEPRRTPTSAWVRARARGRRALYVSSPIGLGHARRDLAIARELRKLHPDLEIDWLAQHPVTTVLEAQGERIHPASAHLANESASLRVRIRRARPALLSSATANGRDPASPTSCCSMTSSSDRQYDLWIGDEAWELDYYLHENPELKTAAFVWLTDFVGYLPMADGGQREALLTADYNAEMIEHVARYPRIRDQAIFVGEPDDIVPERFGPELPPIREWTEEHFSFAGYITGFDPSTVADRQALRAELGYTLTSGCASSRSGAQASAPIF